MALRLTRRDLGPLEKCYAVRPHPGRSALLFASEVRAGGAAFSMEDGRPLPPPGLTGGVMSLVPQPEGALLAVEGFYPPFLAQEAEIIRVGADGRREKLARLPYAHRIEVVDAQGGPWLVAATVCTEKGTRDDWSSPGRLYAGRLSPGGGVPPVLKPLPWKLHRNHGMNSCAHGLLIGAEEGAFLLRPPEGPGQNWTLDRLSDDPCGEAALWDLDGDGAEELICIEGFHGDGITVRARDRDGHYRPVWRPEIPLEFSHALWAGRFGGRATAFLGHRRGRGGLYSLRWEAGQYRLSLQDEGGAPANLAVWRGPEGDALLAANHGQGLCSVYTQSC